MAVQVSYPGVYIDEFAPGAPIQGVGTSTAAFIGVATDGELDTATRITSWRAFKETFGEHPAPGFYLWYAVRGFFDNGGTKCFVVRASNGTFASADLSDRDGNVALKVRARDPGTPNPAIALTVTQAHALPSATTSVFQPTGAYTVTGARSADLTDAAEAALFKPGDLVDLAGAGSRQDHRARDRQGGPVHRDPQPGRGRHRRDPPVGRDGHNPGAPDPGGRGGAR